MHTRYDDYFRMVAQLSKRDLSGKERLERLRSLSAALVDWGTLVFPDESFDIYLHYKEHGMLPFEGALMDQPTWVRRDLTHWTMLEQWWRLNEDMPSVEGLPTLDDLIQSDAP
jgi:hypothetical protein